MNAKDHYRDMALQAMGLEAIEQLRTCLAFIDDASISEGQWHWLDEPRALLARIDSLNTPIPSAAAAIAASPSLPGDMRQSLGTSKGEA